MPTYMGIDIYIYIYVYEQGVRVFMYADPLHAWRLYNNSRISDGAKCDKSLLERSFHSDRKRSEIYGKVIENKAYYRFHSWRSLVHLQPQLPGDRI